MKPNGNSLVLLSGGQDSTTALFWAKSQFAEVHALTIAYGQRHACELQAAAKVAEMAGVASHEVLDLGGEVLKSTSPLTNPNQEVAEYASVAALPGGTEATFVPGRNALFMVIAANRAMVLGTHNIVLGVGQEDYGGYPDCRDKFVASMASGLSLGFYGHTGELAIHTPLMYASKKDTVVLARTLDGAWDALAYSHTCYHGQYPPNPRNHASLLRAKGFAEAQMPDPLILRAKKEGLLPTDWPDTGLIEGTPYADAKAPFDKLPGARYLGEDDSPPPAQEAAGGKKPGKRGKREEE
jgi:7-cyano-7-deazaguanine synthase